MTNSVVVVFFLGLVRFSDGNCSVNTTGVKTFGTECQFTCHCKNDASCDTVTGECSDGCDRNWFGPGCQYRDFAENQVSRHNSNQNPARWALNANDGDTSSCSYTAKASDSKTEPWWRVWFPQNETIRAIYIRTTNTELEYFPGFEVTVEYVPENQKTNNAYVPTYIHTCYQHDNTELGSIDIHEHCEQVFVGNQVRITLPKVKSQLVLCDVKIVEDCLPNKCGYGCTEVCHCKGVETLENKINGICSTGCDGRWTGINDSCNTECANNKWGEACLNKCGACKDSMCDVKTGICPNGCQIGYYETDMCTQECGNGTWGLNCNKTCGNCLSGVCNASDGSCQSGCESGYKNTPLCTEACDDGTFGSNCSGICSVHCTDACNKEDGTCAPCHPGWTDNLCQEECEFGMYGSNCVNRCGFCQTNTICDKITGICPSGCIEGFIGDTCEKGMIQESTQQVIIITIAGSVVAGIVVICVTVIIIVCTLIKRTQSLRNTNQDHDEHTNNPTSLSYEDLQLNCIQNDTEGTYESIGREEMSV